MKYLRMGLVATGVFTCCFLVLKFWLDLTGAAASPVPLGLVRTTLEIEKLTQENRKLKREEAEDLRIVRSPTLEEIDKYGLKPYPFVVEAREERLR